MHCLWKSHHWSRLLSTVTHKLGMQKWDHTTVHCEHMHCKHTFICECLVVAVCCFWWTRSCETCVVVGLCLRLSFYVCFFVRRFIFLRCAFVLVRQSSRWGNETLMMASSSTCAGALSDSTATSVVLGYSLSSNAYSLLKLQNWGSGSPTLTP